MHHWQGHALLSDDGGHTWRLSADNDYGGRYWPNEDQAVELTDGRIASFARGLGFRRTRTVSPDSGEHWGETQLVKGLSEALTGCEGSTVKCPNSSRLVYSGPINEPIIRSKMSLLVSDDDGMTWIKAALIDPGSSAYSSLAWHDGQLGLLYERSTKTKIVFEPDHISFVRLPTPCDGSAH